MQTTLWKFQTLLVILLTAFNIIKQLQLLSYIIPLKINISNVTTTKCLVLVTQDK
jgi:hypothetical protein